jgi:hypothetical protein
VPHPAPRGAALGSAVAVLVAVAARALRLAQSRRREEAVWAEPARGPAAAPRALP